MFIWIRIALDLLFVAAIAIAARYCWQSIYRLRAEVKRFKAEQEAEAAGNRQPGPINPYALMAELHGGDLTGRLPNRSARQAKREAELAAKAAAVLNHNDHAAD